MLSELSSKRPAPEVLTKSQMKMRNYISEWDECIVYEFVCCSLDP